MIRTTAATPLVRGIKNRLFGARSSSERREIHADTTAKIRDQEEGIAITFTRRRSSVSTTMSSGSWYDSSSHSHFEDAGLDHDDETPPMFETKIVLESLFRLDEDDSHGSFQKPTELEPMKTTMIPEEPVEEVPTSVAEPASCVIGSESEATTETESRMLVWSQRSPCPYLEEADSVEEEGSSRATVSDEGEENEVNDQESDEEQSIDVSNERLYTHLDHELDNGENTTEFENSNSASWCDVPSILRTSKRKGSVAPLPQKKGSFRRKSVTTAKKVPIDSVFESDDDLTLGDGSCKSNGSSWSLMSSKATMLLTSTYSAVARKLRARASSLKHLKNKADVRAEESWIDATPPCLDAEDDNDKSETSSISSQGCASSVWNDEAWIDFSPSLLAQGAVACTSGQ